MDCAQIREILSAQLDAEASPEEVAVADAHLACCVPCHRWRASASRSASLFRVRAAEPVPDLVPMVLARASVGPSVRRRRMRVALAAIASIELLAALPGVVLGSGATSIHDGRHLGSFGAAMALALLYVAWQPVRAAGILPVAAMLAGTMLLSATLDLWSHRTTAVAEAHHLVEFAGLYLVWCLAGRPVPPRLAPLVRQGQFA